MTTTKQAVTIYNDFDTDRSIIGTDDEFIVYSEHVLGDLLAPPSGDDDRFLTVEMINQLPGLLAGIAEQLRAHWTVPGEYATQADADHARALGDAELVEQWTIAFASDGEEGLPFEVDIADYLLEVLDEALQAQFPGLIWGCGGPLPETTVRILRSDLVAGIDAQAAHARLVAAVPAWGRFLEWMGPTELFHSTRWAADEFSGIPA